jgi:hypothetical protein
MPNTLTKAPISDGWHGSQTRVKILPKDFVANDDAARMGIVVEDAIAGNGHGITVESSNLEMYAYVLVPQGYKATGLKVAGTEASNRIYSWEACSVGCHLVSLIAEGLSDPARYVGTEYDFNGENTEMVAGLTNYVLIKVMTAASDDIIYGGYVIIEEV